MASINFDDENSSSDSDEEEIICNHLNNKGIGESAAETAAMAVGVATAAGVGVPLAGTAVLSGIGFGSGGIVGGSIAAGIQASIGNVVAGSAFATAQSIGATGGFAILGPVGLGAAALAGGMYGTVKLVQFMIKNNNGNSQLGKKPDNEDKPGEQMQTVASASKDKTEESGEDNAETPAKCMPEKPTSNAIFPEKQPIPLLIKGFTVCDECWLRMQRQGYRRLQKEAKKKEERKLMTNQLGYYANY